MTDTLNRQVRVRVQVPDEAAIDEVVQDLKAQGATDVDVDRNGAGIIDPGSLAMYVMVVMAASSFATWLGFRIRDKFRDGVLIRIAESDDVLVQEIPIPYGQAIVIGPEGTWTKYYDVDSDTKLGPMTTSLAAGMVPSGGTPTSKAEVDREGGEDVAAGGSESGGQQ
jgi:hypothetical protein